MNETGWWPQGPRYNGQCWVVVDMKDEVLVRKYTNGSSNIIVPKYGYRTHMDYATNYKNLLFILLLDQLNI